MTHRDRNREAELTTRIRELEAENARTAGL